MSFGMFGSIFLLAQFFQTAQGYSPLQSGLRILPWTAMPMIVAPIAGALSDRIGGRQDHGHGPGAAGARPRVDRGRDDARASRTSTSSLPFTLSGHRHGALLRPGRERRALVGAAGGGGPGLGRERRDPRARRRLRRRGAGVGVHALRQLRVAADVQRRDGAGRLDRRRRGARWARSPRSRSGAPAARKRSRRTSRSSCPRRPSPRLPAASDMSARGIRPGGPPPLGGGAVPPPSRPRLPARTARVCTPFGGSSPARGGPPSCAGVTMGRVAGRAREQRLLVLGAGPEQLGLLEAAKAHGIWTAVCDRDPSAPGFRLASRRCIVSIEDEPTIERLAAALDLDGVIAPVLRPRRRRRRARRPSGSGSRIPSRPRPPWPSATRSATASCSRTRACRSRAGRSSPASPASSARRASSRRPSATAATGRVLVLDDADLPGRDRGGPRARAQRRRARRGARRRARRSRSARSPSAAS